MASTSLRASKAFQIDDLLRQAISCFERRGQGFVVMCKRQFVRGELRVMPLAAEQCNPATGLARDKSLTGKLSHHEDVHGISTSNLAKPVCYGIGHIGMLPRTTVGEEEGELFPATEIWLTNGPLSWSHGSIFLNRRTSSHIKSLRVSPAPRRSYGLVMFTPAPSL